MSAQHNDKQIGLVDELLQAMTRAGPPLPPSDEYAEEEFSEALGGWVLNQRMTRNLDDLAREMSSRDEFIQSAFSSVEWREEILGHLKDILELQFFGGKQNWPPRDAVEVLADLKARVDAGLRVRSPEELVFPCGWIGGADETFLKIGPVRFEPRLIWLERQKAEETLSESFSNAIFRSWTGQIPFEEVKSRSGPEENLGAYHADVLGNSKHLCSVNLKGFSHIQAERQAKRAAKIAFAAVSLIWEMPSRALAGLTLYRGNTSYREGFIKIDAEKELISFENVKSRMALMDRGHTASTAEVLESFSDVFAIVGEALEYMLSPQESAKRPRMMEALLKALWWLREGCVQEDDWTAIPALVSVMDTLAAGGQVGGIQEFVLNRFKLRHLDKNDNAREEALNYIKEIYDLRSRISHGSGKYEKNVRAFQRDCALKRRGLEILAADALLAAIEYMIENPDCNDVGQLRRAARPTHSVIRNASDQEIEASPN